jgi:hypothetical protein
VGASCDRLAAGMLDLSVRLIDRINRRRTARVEYQLGEEAGTAADIQPDRIRRRDNPIEEDCAGGPTRLSDEALVGGTVVEASVQPLAWAIRPVLDDG